MKPRFIFSRESQPCLNNDVIFLVNVLWCIRQEDRKRLTFPDLSILERDSVVSYLENEKALDKNRHLSSSCRYHWFSYLSHSGSSLYRLSSYTM